MIDAITESALAPFLNQVGWQGFAYGLLGLKTVRKMIEMVRESISGNDEEEEDNNDTRP